MYLGVEKLSCLWRCPQFRGNQRGFTVHNVLYLAHESRDDAVEAGVLEAKTFLSRTQGTEVIYKEFSRYYKGT